VRGSTGGEPRTGPARAVVAAAVLWAALASGCRLRLSWAVVGTAARDRRAAVVAASSLLIVVFGIARLGGILIRPPGRRRRDSGVRLVASCRRCVRCDEATVLPCCAVPGDVVIVAAVTTEGRARRSIEAERGPGRPRRHAGFVAPAGPAGRGRRTAAVVFGADGGGGTALRRRHGPDESASEPERTATLVASEGTTADRMCGSRKPWEALSADRPDRDCYCAPDRPLAGRRLCRDPRWRTVSGEGLRAAVAMPVHVDGRVWGVDRPRRPGTDHCRPAPRDRLTDFTTWSPMAVANAQSRPREVMTSRAPRLVTASDEARRRIERNLHDGRPAASCLGWLSVCRSAGDRPPSPREETRRDRTDRPPSSRGDDELWEISEGSNPAILSESGLGPGAPGAAARRSVVEVQLEARIEGRLPEVVEVAAYYVVSEMLGQRRPKPRRRPLCRCARRFRTAGSCWSWRTTASVAPILRSAQGWSAPQGPPHALGGSFVVDSPPGAGHDSYLRAPDRPPEFLVAGSPAIPTTCSWVGCSPRRQHHPRRADAPVVRSPRSTQELKEPLRAPRRFPPSSTRVRRRPAADPEIPPTRKTWSRRPTCAPIEASRDSSPEPTCADGCSGSCATSSSRAYRKRQNEPITVSQDWDESHRPRPAPRRGLRRTTVIDAIPGPRPGKRRWRRCPSVPASGPSLRCRRLSATRRSPTSSGSPAERDVADPPRRDEPCGRIWQRAS